MAKRKRKARRHAKAGRAHSKRKRRKLTRAQKRRIALRNLRKARAALKRKRHRPRRSRPVHRRGSKKVLRLLASARRFNGSSAATGEAMHYVAPARQHSKHACRTCRAPAAYYGASSRKQFCGLHVPLWRPVKAWNGNRWVSNGYT